MKCSRTVCGKCSKHSGRRGSSPPLHFIDIWNIYVCGDLPRQGMIQTKMNGPILVACNRLAEK